MSSKSISLILKQERNAKNLTPDEVVSMLNERGFSISTKTLYAYEAGTNLPKVPVFIALCEIYQIRDIMGSFGYATVPLCTKETEWESDQYDDFFKGNLHEKILMLKAWGVPSFSEYQEFLNQPGEFAITNNEIKFLKMYRRLDERGKAAVLNVLNHEYESLPGEKADPAPKEA